MSYEPTNWKSGDVVTSAKLNKMEQGIASGLNILLVGATSNGPDTLTLNKTWQEIFDADLAFLVIEDGEREIFLFNRIYGYGDTYVTYAGDLDFMAQTAGGYPVHFDGK